MRIGVRILGGFCAALGLVVLAGGVGLFSMGAVDSIVSRITGQIFPKITAVVRSSRFVTSVSRSTPTTSALRDDPERMASFATPSA